MSTVMQNTPRGIDDDLEAFDAEYLGDQVRLIHGLTSIYSPPPRVNVIAAGRLAADLEDRTYESPNYGLVSSRGLGLLTALCALGALLDRPEEERAKLYGQHGKHGDLLSDEALERAAADVAEMLNETVNGSEVGA